MAKLIRGVNDLATVNPKLAKEWHPWKNGDLKPNDVTANSGKKVWWLLPYDDPNTGRHFDFEWETQIFHRTNGVGCPYLSNPIKAIYIGFNDLLTTHPQIAKEWHYEKNGDLKPTDVTAKSGKKVWWLLSYDDPNTGRHFDFEWKAQICNRVNGRDCPYITGRAVWKGFNDLATTHTILAKQWHPTKNGDLKPTDVSVGCNKKVWWICQFHHSFSASIVSRSQGSRCPICSKERGTSFPEQAIYYYIKLIFPDAENRYIKDGIEFDIYIPSLRIAIEYDGENWHKDIKKDLKKNQYCIDNEIILYRIREKGCPNMDGNENVKIISCTTNNEKGLEQAIIHLCNNLNIKGNIDINKDRNEIYNQYLTIKENDNLAIKNQNLAAQWHPTKNGHLKPTDVFVSSRKKVWWLLPYDDPKTGKHFDFEWQSTVYNRSKGKSCPYLSGRAVWKGFNDLETYCKENHMEYILNKWDYNKNGDLKPCDITKGSRKKVWWIDENGNSFQKEICRMTRNL